MNIPIIHPYSEEERKRDKLLEAKSKQAFSSITEHHTVDIPDKEEDESDQSVSEYGTPLAESPRHASGDDSEKEETIDKKEHEVKDDKEKEETEAKQKSEEEPKKKDEN